MITLPNGKICMNEQEAIQWLLDNYPIPFQCSANYTADTEIGLGTIVNPTPAKVKVGSIIFFADSKVSTVVGLTANGFICSDQYNDLVDDVVYVSNVAINASGHLIVTLSNGTNIDAGLIKQVSNFSINASQHLIANYNDGSSNDLGAIFSGNINIAGTLSANTMSVNNPQGFLGNTVSPLDEDFSLTVKDLSGISPDLRVEVKYAHKRISNGKLTIVIQLALENNGASSIAVPASTELLASDQLISLPAGITSYLYGAGPAPSFQGVLDTMAGVKGTSYSISTGYYYGSGPLVELRRGNLIKYGSAVDLENSPMLAEGITLEAGKGITWRKEFNFIL